MEIVYRLIVLYFAVHIVLDLFGRKKVRDQAGPAVVLVLFVLRLLLVK
ncbi:MAG: hypothetical protein M0C28_35310 [Candidatus Moduliflexus flocculans]|nr:hypothetical protein [Candidatus Moduliflexus flocculans]